MDPLSRRTGTRRRTRRRSSPRSARPRSGTTSARSTTSTRCCEAHGDWLPLGNADEQKPAAEGTVEAWARSADNPVGGFYGLKKGLRGRFANYVPPVLEALGTAEVEHQPRNNRMRAI